MQQPVMSKGTRQHLGRRGWDWITALFVHYKLKWGAMFSWQLQRHLMFKDPYCMQSGKYLTSSLPFYRSMSCLKFLPPRLGIASPLCSFALLIFYLVSYHWPRSGLVFIKNTVEVSKSMTEKDGIVSKAIQHFMLKI